MENPDYHLVKNDGDESEHPKSKAAYIGVLMQVTDYEQLDDGRLALVVQALERFRVIEATQHEPYAVATVQLLPDIELALPHFREAQKMAKELSDDFLDEKDAWGAACAAAVETAEQIRGFEYRPVSVHESSNGLVAPLVNFDMDADVEKYFPRNIKEVESRRSKVKNVMEQHLLSASPLDVPDNLEKIDTEHVLQLEHEVWLEVDTLIKLLHQLNPNSNQEAQITPIPTQILGLLPRESNGHSEGTCAWPDDFQLDQYAKRLEDYANSMTVGTYSKSPFVRYDYAANTKSPYPSLRRAQRLSFVVWVLLENIAILGDEDENVATKLLSRQEILELGSITERLEAAKTRLDAINQALKIVAGR